MPVSEMKYSASAGESPRKYEPIIAPAMMSADHTVDSSPIEKPDRIVVAGPVTVDSAISWTGRNFVSVKYWVRIWISEARTSPMITAIAGLTLSM